MTPSKKENTTVSHKEIHLTRSERRPTATFHNKKTNTVIFIKYTAEPLIIRKKHMKSSNAAANMANLIQTASHSTITAVTQRATFIRNSPFKTTSVDHNDTDYLANNLHHNATNSFTHAVHVITSTENWDNSVSVDRTFSTHIPTRTRNSKHQMSTKTEEADFSNMESNLTMYKTKMPIGSDIKSTSASTTVDHINARGFFTGSETTEDYTKATIIYASRDTKMPKEAKNYTSSDITTMITSTTTATISTTMIMTATATKDGNNIYTPKLTYRYHTLSWLSGDFTFSAPTSTTITTSSAILGAKPSNTDDSPEYIAPNIGVIIPETSSSVIIKFTHPSYSQMVQDDLLTARFVQSLPLLVSHSLNISPDNVIITTISYLLDQDSGLVVSLAIPNDQVSNLQNLISNQTSILYSGNNSQLANLIDPSYFVVSNQSFGHSEQSTAGTDGSSSGLSKSVLIAVCVSVGTFIYAIVAVVVYKVYKKQKNIEQAANPTVRVHCISEPIMQDNSLERSINSQPPHPASL
ncbi:hypothetical protein RO3G_13325 [Rhizopus delemar RA 99-880]|uniref:Uncharacterized protein n=1 Tax=Rhizopus delemar (strain RA 99-880 / ATCC MYA-4621 / FGSC 9543 / NRRL 43880) TaxID=246409 RepID=I1CJI4_RHIO9|nr:hypothetical protein RO3G_13325 [Rhizopus delemar RA 99-880]|eukprot:EIE88614.1 hypothetical protein RO3G_13325 [Rhizopus delemar RA 99-880]